MTLVLSNTDSLSPPSTPAGHIAAARALAAKPGQPGLVFSEAIGQLDDLLGQIEAGRAETGSADASATVNPSPATDIEGASVAPGETEHMPAALSSFPLVFGMALGSLPTPALPEVSVTAAGEHDASTAAADVARLPLTGGLAVRMTSLAGAMAMPRPLTEEAGAPTRQPAAGAERGDLPEALPENAVTKKAAIEGAVAGALGNSRTLTAETTPAVAAGVAQTVAPVADSSSATPAVKLSAGAPEQWRRPLLEALGERIQVEIAKRSEHAVIRLDPPMMGHVEIVIRHEAGSLQIQLSASNGEVLRQLQNISDSLRQDLAQRQYTDISVQIYAGSSDSDGRRRPDALPEEDAPGLALAEADTEQAASSFVLAPDRD